MVDFNPSFILVALYTMLCLLAGFQVCRILYYRHSRFSFQFGFLLLCFAWTSLRVVYFVLVYPPEVQVSCLVNQLIFGLPIVVQFATFSLLLLFYAYWVHKSEWESYYRKRFVISAVSFNVCYLVLYLVWVGFRCQDLVNSLMNQLQVALTGTIFLTLTFLLIAYGWRLFNLTNTSYNQLIRIRPREIVAITTVIVLIFTTRSIDDFLSVSSSFRKTVGHPLAWFDFCCYAFWEITPTMMVLIYFRRIPKTNFNRRQFIPVAPLTFKAKDPPPRPHGLSSRLWDDPQRYDSDEEHFVRSPSWSAIYGTSAGSNNGLPHGSGSDSGGGLGAALLAHYGRNYSSESLSSLQALARPGSSDSLSRTAGVPHAATQSASSGSGSAAGTHVQYLVP